MGGECPTLACSHLASLLQMVPLKPSLPTSSARWLASLHSKHFQLGQLRAVLGRVVPLCVHMFAHADYAVWPQEAVLTA